MKSPIVKRSIVVGGHKATVSLEDEFLSALQEIAHGQNMTVSNMVATIDRTRKQSSLSSAIRLFVLGRVCARTFSVDLADGVKARTVIQGNIEMHSRARGQAVGRNSR